MNIEMKRNAEVTTIEITGRLDTTTAPVLDKTINEDMEGTKDLILDLKHSYTSSSSRATSSERVMPHLSSPAAALSKAVSNSCFSASE